MYDYYISELSPSHLCPPMLLDPCYGYTQISFQPTPKIWCHFSTKFSRLRGALSDCLLVPSLPHIFCFVLFCFSSVLSYLLIYLLTYARRSRQRPSTTPRPRTLFWAVLAIPVQLVLCVLLSASRLQLLRGRPLFLFPYGFQVRAWRMVLDAGFLRVCPIHPHFLRSICLAIGSCPARSHRSSFWIFSCHRIL